MASSERLKCRNSMCLIEKLIHKNMLITCSSCTCLRNKNELKYGDPPFYTGKLGALGVIDIINNNRSLVEPFTDILDNAFERYNKDIQLNIDPFG